MSHSIKNADYSTPAAHLLYGVRRKNMPLLPIFDAAEIPCSSIENQQEILDYRQFINLLRAVNRATKDEFFGLTGRRCKPGSYAMMARTGLQSGTLKGFITHCCEFYYLLTDDVHFWFEEVNEQAFISVKISQPKYDPNYFLVDYWMLHLYLSFSWVTGLRLPLLSTQSSLPDEPSPERLLYYIKPSWQTGQLQHSFSFHTKYLKLPIIKTPTELSAHLKFGKGRLPVWPSDEMTASAQVRGYLKRRLLMAGMAENFEHMACSFNTTARSLRRVLKIEGVSYQQLLDEARRDFAIELLQQHRKSVSYVAERLGFSEARSFSRAFKVWTGSPPSHFQEGFTR